VIGCHYTDKLIICLF